MNKFVYIEEAGQYYRQGKAEVIHCHILRMRSVNRFSESMTMHMATGILDKIPSRVTAGIENSPHSPVIRRKFNFYYS